MQSAIIAVVIFFDLTTTCSRNNSSPLLHDEPDRTIGRHPSQCGVDMMHGPPLSHSIIKPPLNLFSLAFHHLSLHAANVL
jgi:hypothetical protein